jgi:hypothetical protein
LGSGADEYLEFRRLDQNTIDVCRAISRVPLFVKESAENKNKNVINMILKMIERIGFFRLTMVPMGLAIIYSAWQHRIWGMGIVGAVVLVFGLLNRCLLGHCRR